VNDARLLFAIGDATFTGVIVQHLDDSTVLIRVEPVNGSALPPFLSEPECIDVDGYEVQP
jgi:hypothetical protein